MNNKVVITIMETGRSFEKEIKLLQEYGFIVDYRPVEAADDVDTIINKVKGYNFVLAGPELWSREVIESVKDSLRMIVRLGTGVDKVDKEAATENGIAVCNTPGANACSVAQHAIALMLDLSLSITKYDRNLRKGVGKRGLAHDLIGKTVGLLGFGCVAKELAILLSGFKTEIIYYDVNKNEEAANKLNVKYAELDELIKLSDYISLHLPLNKSTKGMVDIKFLKSMKSSAYIINTSRGEIIKESDLTIALQEGMIAGAGLDVFEKQPISPENPLLKLENVVVTPYTAFNSQLGWDRTMKMAMKCLYDFYEEKENGGMFMS